MVVTTDDAAMAEIAGQFDFILDTISADHDRSALLNLLWLGGTLCVLGNPLMGGPRLLEPGKAVRGSPHRAREVYHRLRNYCSSVQTTTSHPKSKSCPPQEPAKR